MALMIASDAARLHRFARDLHAASFLLVRLSPGIGALKVMGIGVALINPAS
jgi:hypothetical protein